MKPRSSFTALFIAFFAIPFALNGQQSLTPLIPSGSLSAFPTIVQAGTHPTLSWNVTLPEAVGQVVNIQTPGSVSPGRCLIMDVRVLGASLKTVKTNPQGKVTGTTWIATQAMLNYNANGYNQIFYNTGNKVIANSVIHSRMVEANSTINFGGRYATSSTTWSPFYSSTNSQYNVVALKDGDIPPTASPLHLSPTLQSFMVPYLDVTTGKIKLGARDIMVMMDLTDTVQTNAGFDLQDLVLLVTFYDRVVVNGATTDCSGTTTTTTSGGTTTTTTTTSSGNGNNGHGNNVDGVDSSNPGNAPFTDTNPLIDDERGRRNQ